MLNKINSILSLSYIDRDGKKYDASDLINKYNHPGYYLSLTELDKIGINPKSKYDTPLGIYAYNIPEAIRKYKIDFTDRENEDIIKDHERRRQSDEDILFKLPFAFAAKYLNILKIKDESKRLNLNNINKKYYESIIKKLINKVGKEKVSFVEDGLEYLMYLYCDDIDKSDVDKIKKTYAGRIWNIIRFCSVDNLTLNPKEYRKQKEEKENKKYNVDSLKWNKFLRDLGYDVVDDLGKGVIHPSEPQQSIFLSIKSFDIVERFDNSYNTRKSHDINSIKGRKSVFRNKVFKKIKRKELMNNLFENCKINIDNDSNLINIYNCNFESCDIKLLKEKVRIRASNLNKCNFYGSNDSTFIYYFDSIKSSKIFNIDLKLNTKKYSSSNEFSNCNIGFDGYHDETAEVDNSIFNNCVFSTFDINNIEFRSCTFVDSVNFTNSKRLYFNECYWNISRENTLRLNNMKKDGYVFKNCFILVNGKVYNLPKDTTPQEFYEKI